MLLNLISIALYASWHPYMNFFMNSARHNPQVVFTLITNLDEHHESWVKAFGNVSKPPNVHLAHYTFDMIAAKIHENNLGLGSEPLSVKTPYKLIDFKPMYGVIFSKELVGYTHWGWFDLDIHLGDVKGSYECDYRNEDFISFDNVRVHGPLMVSRNTEFVTTVYQDVLNYPKSLAALRGDPAILFDEKHMPYLVSKNPRVTLKKSHRRNCACEVWMWYKGQMQASTGSCVVQHFGGGGSVLSRGGKNREWARFKAFFEGGYHESGEYGYGSVDRFMLGEFSFVFTFNSTNDFVIVNTTSSENDTTLKKLIKKFAKQLRLFSSRFLEPNSVCLPKHLTSP